MLNSIPFRNTVRLRTRYYLAETVRVKHKVEDIVDSVGHRLIGGCDAIRLCALPRAAMAIEDGASHLMVARDAASIQRAATRRLTFGAALVSSRVTVSVWSVRRSLAGQKVPPNRTARGRAGEILLIAPNLGVVCKQQLFVRVLERPRRRLLCLL